MIISICSFAQPTSIKSVGCTEFKAGMATADAVLLDVSNVEDYNSGHIKGAINIPISDPKFLDKVHAQIPKTKTVYIYDKSDNRSVVAAQFLKYQNYKTFINLKGGLTIWKSEGYDIE